MLHKKKKKKCQNYCFTKNDFEVAEKQSNNMSTKWRNILFKKTKTHAIGLLNRLRYFYSDFFLKNLSLRLDRATRDDNKGSL